MESEGVPSLMAHHLRNVLSVAVKKIREGKRGLVTCPCVREYEA